MVAMTNPTAAAASTCAPAAQASSMVDRPNITEAPARRMIRCTSVQPLRPARSARHISPEKPATTDSSNTIHNGRSTKACCCSVTDHLQK
ncbi:hypothetical protein D9M73_223720 [compost metagenome]